MNRFLAVICVLLLAGCATPSVTTATPTTTATSTTTAASEPSGTCLSSRDHVAGDADNTPLVICVYVGEVVDLNALAAGGHQPGVGHWTAVTSSEDTVLGCALADGHATCKTLVPGHAMATATGAAGAWRVQVFVAGPAG
jgi:hypothetical protein